MQSVQVPEFPAGRPWVRAVMASTLDGAIRGSDGGSRSISTPADQRWFSALRHGPQALLVGAGTIRAENYRPSRCVMAVVSARLDLPASLRMFAERTDAHPRPIVLTTDAGAADPPAHLRELTDVVGCGADGVDLHGAIAALNARGLQYIQCEGGPRLLSDLIAADPVGWLGADHVARWGSSPALLVKLLDAGERLPVHVHPDREFAVQHFASPFGKTEAWIAIESVTAKVGFSLSVSISAVCEWVTEQNIEAMLDAMTEVTTVP